MAVINDDVFFNDLCENKQFMLRNVFNSSFFHKLLMFSEDPSDGRVHSETSLPLLSTLHYNNGFQVFSNTSAIAKAQTSSLEGRWDFSPAVQHSYVYVPMETEMRAYGERIHYSAVKWRSVQGADLSKSLAAAEVWLKVLVQKLTAVFRRPEWALVMFVHQMTI